MRGLAFAGALLAACAAVSPALVSPALAADAILEQPVAGFNWSGAYLGGQVGYAWGNGRGEFATGDSFDADPDGFLGGIYAGADYQFANRIVLGVDADYTFSDAGDDGAQVVDPGGTAFPFNNLGTVDLDWSAAVRGRVGYAVDRFLPYVAAGVAWGKVDYSVRTDILGTYSDGDDTLTGYTVGAGLEYAFTDRLIARAEYRFTDFGDADFDNSTLAAPINVDLKTSDVRVGLSYKF